MNSYFRFSWNVLVTVGNVFWCFEEGKEASQRAVEIVQELDAHRSNRHGEEDLSESESSK